MKSVVLLLGVFTWIQSLAAPFVNLGFDDAITNNVRVLTTPSGDSYQIGTTSDLLPGWTLTLGGTVVTNMNFNTRGTVDAAVLYDMNAVGLNLVPPEGEFALFLASQSQPYELSQTAEVPPDSRFLSCSPVGWPCAVKIQDELLEPIPPGSYAYLFAGRTLLFDVTRFAGETVKLSLTQQGDSGWLDTIQFFAQPPRLRVSRSGSRVIVSWPTTPRGFYPQLRDAFAKGFFWQPFVSPSGVSNGQNVVTVNLNNGEEFFRLAPP